MKHRKQGRRKKGFAMRNYVGIFEYTFHGTYTREIEFCSDHRANSKANYEDCMKKIRARYERGISNNATILKTYLAD